MSRLLIVPAAGRGTRLGSGGPKVLYPVAGRPMLDYLLDLYAARVDHIVLILHPSFMDAVAAHCRGRGVPIDLAVQAEPTGMLPAILLGKEAVLRHEPDDVWITWCDQIAIRPVTLARLAATSEREPRPAMTFPTVTRTEPYIHFARDERGVISEVLQRRESAQMPAVGEGDAGLFSLTRRAYLEDLDSFAREATPGAQTGEANFLPFIPWLAVRERVETFPVEHESESIGINTPADVELIRRHLRVQA